MVTAAGRIPVRSRWREHLAIDRVLDDVLWLRHEDLALDEGPHGEGEQDQPDGTHEDAHDEVPGVEAAQLEDVPEDADG